MRRTACVATLHPRANPPRKFGYTDNGPHKKDDTARFVLISIAVLIHDFSKAVESFVNQIRTDSDPKQRVDDRIRSLFFTSLINH